jgi:hypothetical protein
MQVASRSFSQLREYVQTVPLVDCHDHTDACEPRYADPIMVVASGYFPSDLISASSEKEFAFFTDTSKSLDERWPVFQKAWNRTCHTGYALVARTVLDHFYGEKSLDLPALKRMKAKLLDLTDRALFERILDDARIMVRLVNVWQDPAVILSGAYTPSPKSRIVIPLPEYHEIRNYGSVQKCLLPLHRVVTGLDEYLQGCRQIFEGYKANGAVAFKDQSAYVRTLDIGNPTRAAAEEVFNRFMEDPRRSAAYPEETKPLEDFLYHEFMRMARDMDLPVQIHTGHLAGNYNDIAKTNAVHLTRFLELHRDVRFDLLHANWPYAGELLYLAKTYPNVAIDFCWANIIDPVYCQDLFRQALSSVPHGKVHGYGSDFVGQADQAWAHASIARDNISIALAGMVDIGYLGVEDAKEVARSWLYDNPNAFFRLGLPPVPR